jgi:tRNA threonylcarbamoyladenosine biosynthesis protein TsaB
MPLNTAPVPAAPLGGEGVRAGRFLAFDTSTERMSIAVRDGARLWQHEGAGAAQSSATLIPAILQLMSSAGLRLDQLGAIAFGRGPGSFTGLRTACAVAQGLALGAGVAVLPIDTLLAVAEEARFQWMLTHPGQTGPQRITALLDARMDEMYVQHFSLAGGACQALAPCALLKPEALQWPAPATDTPSPAFSLLAGNVFEVYAGRLPALPPGSACLKLLPSASAMLRLAPALAAAGALREAAQALPLYVRDKVALTTDEREQAKRQLAETAQAAQAAQTTQEAHQASLARPA